MHDTPKNTPLYGLVLSGGKSTRMGMDKGAITYHGRTQREHLYDLLNQVCDKTFLSIRPDQNLNIGDEKLVIIDEDNYKGPFNGMLSAHRLFPDVAWLVLACDLPFIDVATLKKLIAARDIHRSATALATSESGLPEPLAAIWEPAGLRNAGTYLDESGTSCPRKYLINSDTALVFPENDISLFNANSLEEYHEARAKLTL